MTRARISLPLLVALGLVACSRTAPLPEAPTLALSAETLSFVLQSDGASVLGPQSIAIRNAGPGALAVPMPSITLAAFGRPPGSPDGWLSAAVVAEAGGYRLFVEPTVQPGSCFLAAGEYVATVTLTSPGAANSPRNVQVTLRVPPPRYVVPPVTLSFTAPLDGSDPPPQVAQVVNLGGYARPFVDVLVPGSWIAASAREAPGSFATWDVSFGVATASLTAGQYAATAFVYALPQAGTDHLQGYLAGLVDVSLEVPPPRIQASAASLAFRTRAGEPHAAQTVTIANTGRRTDASPGLRPHPVPDGWSVWPLEQGQGWPRTFLVEPHTEELAPGVYSTSLVASLEHLGGNRVTVPVTFTIDPPLAPHLAPSQLSFHAIAGRNPPPRSVVLTDPTFPAVPVAASTLQPDWLRFSVEGAASPYRVVVSPATSTLPVGFSYGSISFRGGQDWERSLPVQLEVGHWQPTGAMASERRDHAALALPDGRALALGGFGFDPWVFTPTATSEIYDPATGAWVEGPSLLGPRWAHSATLLADGRVLVAGGGAADGSVRADAEILDLRSGTRTLVILVAGRYRPTATLLADGRVLLVSGSTAEIVDPAQARSIPAGSPALDHRGGAAVRLPSGKVLVVGSGETPEAGCELFDPATGTWSPTGPMAFKRVRPSVVLLPDGRALALGGGARSMEAYDPGTGMWSPAGAVPGAGIVLAAARVGTKVLVADAGAGAGAGIDLFDPASAAWESYGAALPWEEGMSVTVLADGTALAAGLGRECQLWGIFR